MKKSLIVSVLSTLVITAGAAIAVSSSSQKEQDYNVEILKCLCELLMQRDLIYWFFIISIKQQTHNKDL